MYQHTMNYRTLFAKNWFPNPDYFIQSVSCNGNQLELCTWNLYKFNFNTLRNQNKEDAVSTCLQLTYTVRVWKANLTILSDLIQIFTIEKKNRQKNKFCLTVGNFMDLHNIYNQYPKWKLWLRFLFCLFVYIQFCLKKKI